MPGRAIRRMASFGGTAVAFRPTGSRRDIEARSGRTDYLLVASTGILEPLPTAEPRLGRRTALTLPLLPPPQKN
jgi:hypothetical protein